mmetsp:Transcript_38393/g.69852  ORF Transcript_38393/g.69852 Transcript_38393/m.69852 type:complete len:88 (-) Transcript_38393:1796-2059(-)
MLVAEAVTGWASFAQVRERGCHPLQPTLVAVYVAMQTVHRCEAGGVLGLGQRRDEGAALGWLVDRWEALQDGPEGEEVASQPAWVRL